MNDNCSDACQTDMNVLYWRGRSCLGWSGFNTRPSWVQTGWRVDSDSTLTTVRHSHYHIFILENAFRNRFQTDMTPVQQEHIFMSAGWNTWTFYSYNNSLRRFKAHSSVLVLIPGSICQACVGHLLSEAIGLLLVLSELLLPLLHAAVGLLQRRHQLGVAVL